ncbi:hypothetical protein [Chromatium okenii]|uniref:hypothetical protein n=1 Tax=Chromatium okenii TaxID=61644 RepID=UPI001906B8BA|nr:hypothetical protein [Chromatium okenii]
MNISRIPIIALFFSVTVSASVVRDERDRRQPLAITNQVKTTEWKSELRIASCRLLKHWLMLARYA